MNVGKLIFILDQPKIFFQYLKKDNQYKSHIIFFLIISFMFYLIWFINVYFDIKNEYKLDTETVLHRYMFSSINQRFLYYTAIYLAVDILIVLIVTIIISLLSKVICLIIGINLGLKDFWKITIYSSSPVLLNLLLIIIFSLSGYGSIPFFVKQLPGLYAMILFIIGVRAFRNKLD